MSVGSIGLLIYNFGIYWLAVIYTPCCVCSLVGNLDCHFEILNVYSINWVIFHIENTYLLCLYAGLVALLHIWIAILKFPTFTYTIKLSNLSHWKQLECVVCRTLSGEFQLLTANTLGWLFLFFFCWHLQIQLEMN